MFGVEGVRENNRAGLLISSFAAHTAAMALVLIMVLGPSTASAIMDAYGRVAWVTSCAIAHVILRRTALESATIATMRIYNMQL
jgi:hypothetical protein